MRKIKLTQGKVALVDDADFEWLNKFNWCAMNNHGRGWYAVRSARDANGKRYGIYMHRQIAGARPGQRADHKDGNGLHNWQANLRICTRSQNHANSQKQAGCSSQYKGVHWNKWHGKWQVQIMVRGKALWLGYFDDELMAARAYNKTAQEHFGEFARLNVVGKAQQIQAQERRDGE